MYFPFYRDCLLFPTQVTCTCLDLFACVSTCVITEHHAFCRSGQPQQNHCCSCFRNSKNAVQFYKKVAIHPQNVSTLNHYRFYMSDLDYMFMQSHILNLALYFFSSITLFPVFPFPIDIHTDCQHTALCHNKTLSPVAE